MIDQIIVLGGGAIGSVYAAKLAARHDVTLIARPAHADAIAATACASSDAKRRRGRMRAATAVDAHRSRHADPADDQGQRLAPGDRAARWQACATTR